MNSKDADVQRIVEEIRTLVHAAKEEDYAELYAKLKEIGDDIERRYGANV